MILAITYTGSENPVLERNVIRWFYAPNGNLNVVYLDESKAIFEQGVVEESWLDQDTYDRYGGGPVVNPADEDTVFYDDETDGTAYAGP